MFPVYLAVSADTLWWLPALVIMVFSMAYHATENILLEWLDTSVAILFLVSGPGLLLSAGAGVTEWVVSVGVVLGAGMVYLQSRSCRLRGLKQASVWWHATWHVSASGLASVIYSFTFGYIQW